MNINAFFFINKHNIMYGYNRQGLDIRTFHLSLQSDWKHQKYRRLALFIKQSVIFFHALHMFYCHIISMDHQPTQIEWDTLYHAANVVGKRTLLKMDILSERNPILLEFIKKGCVRFNQLVTQKVLRYHNAQFFKTLKPYDCTCTRKTCHLLPLA